MIGGDYLGTKFSIEKDVVDGEAAWLSNFERFLSEPTNIGSSSSSRDKVRSRDGSGPGGICQNLSEFLWKMEDPIGKKKVNYVKPAFPLRQDIENNRYEVWLLCKSDSRLQNNKRRAVSPAFALRQRLVRDHLISSPFLFPKVMHFKQSLPIYPSPLFESLIAHLKMILSALTCEESLNPTRVQHVSNTCLTDDYVWK